MIPGSDSTTGDLEAEQGEPGEEPSDEPCPHPGIRIVFYVWSGNEVIAEYSDSLLDCQYVYANGMRIAQLKRNYYNSKDTTYLHSDYQGSTRLTTSRTPAILSQTDYDVWGQVRQQVGSVGNEYTYTGQAWESDLGINLFYLNARYYDPKLGRFTTPDPLPSDLNPYSYCNNNPAMMTDVSGMSGNDWWRIGGSLPPGTQAGAYRGGSTAGGNGGNWVSDLGGPLGLGDRLPIAGEALGGDCGDRASHGYHVSGGVSSRAENERDKQLMILQMARWAGGLTSGQHTALASFEFADYKVAVKEMLGKNDLYEKAKGYKGVPYKFCRSKPLRF